MKLIKRMETVLIHLCCICSLLLLAVQVLNWYNPYMGVLEQNLWIMDCLCLGSILSAVLFTMLEIRARRGQRASNPSNAGRCKKQPLFHAGRS